MVHLSSLLLSVGNLSGNIALIITCIILIIFSAFFSGVETAFTSCNAVRMKNMADDNVKGARKTIKVLENFDKSLSTLLVGNNIVNIANTTLCAYLFSTFITNPTIANILNTVIMTILILTFGEILPKCLAKRKAEKIALKTAGVLLFLNKVLLPLTLPFSLLQKSMVKKIETKEVIKPTVTEDELESIIDTMEEEGVLDSKNADLIQSVLALREKSAYDIMTPRVDVEAISISDSIEKVQEKFITTMYSRLPVYTKDIDHIVGVLNQKDFFASVLSTNNNSIRKLMQHPLFINENLKVDKILRAMQKSKKHEAIVLDEYGGTSGIVCLEDALEEMVGEIYDEHDDDIVESTVKLDNKTMLVDGDLELEKLFDTLQIEHLPQTDYNTLSGFLYELTENLPSRGQIVHFKTLDERETANGEYITVPIDLEFTLEKVEDRRIKQVKVRVLDYSECEKKD